VEKAPDVLEGFMEVIRDWGHLAAEVEYRLSSVFRDKKVILEDWTHQLDDYGRE